jgi:hypothetical protein
VTIEHLNDKERTDFALWLLLAHGKFTWECDECDCLTDSLVMAGEHMVDEHPDLVAKGKAHYAKWRL